MICMREVGKQKELKSKTPKLFSNINSNYYQLLFLFALFVLDAVDRFAGFLAELETRLLLEFRGLTDLLFVDRLLGRTEEDLLFVALLELFTVLEGCLLFTLAVL